jgi:hypothetical protein
MIPFLYQHDMHFDKNLGQCVFAHGSHCERFAFALQIVLFPMMIWMGAAGITLLEIEGATFVVSY